MASKELLLKVLDANGKEIESLGTPSAAGSATFTDNTTAPEPVGSSTPGSSFVAAAQDHTHEGVHGVGVDGDPVATGDINLVSGPGITIERVGQDIVVGTADGARNKISLSHDGAAYSIGVGEDVIREWLINFGDAPGAQVTAMLAAIVKASAGVGTFKLRVGATAPGAVAGSSVVATFTSTSATEEMKENVGAPFANPTGFKLVQVTATNDTANAKSQIRGVAVSIG